ncbi:uncharacterized protein LOC124288156 isoform X2 [Haliotis rubra]|uniref:uncharacterized protein LOC124288156 isoform X2 n=1 Tax=Haliotis rubra TaxID=36100 RepID=UPI001EE5BE4E|nr:uncharacterized protein LOC124288156 isoform X2 [Haliotis rubra]
MFLSVVMVMYVITPGVKTQNTITPVGFTNETRGDLSLAPQPSGLTNEPSDVSSAAPQPSGLTNEPSDVSSPAPQPSGLTNEPSDVSSPAPQPSGLTNEPSDVSSPAPQPSGLTNEPSDVSSPAIQPIGFTNETRGDLSLVSAVKEASIKVATTFQVVCDKCDYDKGYGYVRDPHDCDTYYQCVKDRKIYYTFHCSPGLVWDNKALTCNWPHLVHGCSEQPDPCEFMASDPDNPYGYKVLTSGNWLFKTCPVGEMYDPHTCTCVPDPCYNKEHDPRNPRGYKLYVNRKWVMKLCAFWQIYNPKTCTCVADPCYQKKAHPANKHVYLQYVHYKWIVRPCAQGTAYNKTSCNCDIHSSVSSIQGCTPVLYLPLFYNTKDVAHNHHVDNHGVYIHYDIPAAVWDGSSSLSVPYFRNGYYGDELTISFYYFRVDNTTRVVVSNSLCDGEEATIYIIVVFDGVCFHVTNHYGQKVVMCVPCPAATGWSFAMLKIHNGKMIGVTGSDYKVLDFYGKISPTKCPLSIGKGLDHPNFYGKIVQFVMYVGCNPHLFRNASALVREGSVSTPLVGTTEVPSL